MFFTGWRHIMKEACAGRQNIMSEQPFQALVADKTDGNFHVRLQDKRTEDLPDGELLIRILYSSVNYKDALACQSDGNVIRDYPRIPGIDLAGVVEHSRDPAFREGDEVFFTGYELGVGRDGGFSRYARVPSAWAVKRPVGLTLQESMILGTAGFTAAMSVLELQQAGVRPESGPVLVTGATGGVGSLSVSILAKLGYEVAAVTGKPDMHDHLLRLGASRILSREEILPDKPRPLDKQLWAGAVDCVGGKPLSSILSSVRYGGAVAASGLTAGTELALTVLPFILRGVRLIGIDSVNAPMDKRVGIWERLAGAFKPDQLDTLYTEIPLGRIPEAAASLLAGQSRGRILVNPWL
jgi:acrylyl-CoA reductase (NADPH)